MTLSWAADGLSSCIRDWEGNVMGRGGGVGGEVGVWSGWAGLALAVLQLDTTYKLFISSQKCGD